MPVPCQTCTACCHAEVVVDWATEPKSNREHLKTEERADGTLVLKRTPDGACGHLGPGGCRVYRYRPLACRGYDCRLQGLAGLTERFAGGHESPRWQWTPEPTQRLQAMVREVISDAVGA